MNKKLGQEPAFAALAIDKSIKSDEQTTEHSLNGNNGNNGMSKRFYAACAAIQGLLANPYLMESLANDAKITQDDQLRIIKSSYQYADELLKQENNE